MIDYSQRNAGIQVIATIIVVAAVLFIFSRHLLLSMPIPVILRDRIEIPDGVSAYGVANILVERGLLKDARPLVNAFRLVFGTRRIQAGSYQLLNVRHYGDLVRQILDPPISAVTVTIPEGLRRADIANIIATKYVINIDRFVALTEDSSFIKGLGFVLPSLEGYLLPETYKIRMGSTEQDIIEMMVREGQSVLTEDILRNGELLGFDSHDILTMASIIEGETRYDPERNVISAVYHNRLKKRMRLQADPTVQYAIPDGPRRLLFRDYKYPSPYNTYLHRGLPPGPINNPGRASIEAAVNPSDVDYLYFVANGLGGHIFTSTNDEHNQAIKDIRRR